MRRLSLVAAAALATLAAGCGGGGHSAATATAGPSARALPFARCMRAHGIPNWPDPTSDGGFDKAKLRALGVADSRIRALEDGPCSHLPAGPPPPTAQQERTRLADRLSFARCMRSHGVGRFPDPTAQGQLSVEMVQAAGVDIRSPQVLHVVQACLPASHGALTPAKVREALNNAGR